MNRKKGAKKLILAFALLANIGLFVYFKYSNFFIDNINAVLQTDFFIEKILLPLGISFFTFQQISFIIDAYRDEVPDYSFLNYATFVAFFPQLIAGPIVLHQEIIPQFQERARKTFNYENFSKGILAFAIGLGKKVLIADLFGRVVTLGYEDVGSLGAIRAILVALSYTIQIYFDFSGYCDMATGLGLMFNIEIPQNFNSPYKALTIPEFWQRWHMTLTRFFKKYLYFPLGGNRKGTFRTYVNVFIIFIVSGFWHGANWTFIIWGAMHGIANILTKIFDKQIKKLPRAVNWFITFVFVNLTWIYFRAPSIGDANKLIGRIFSMEFGSVGNAVTHIFKSNVFVNSIGLLDSIPGYLYLIGTLIFVFILLFSRNTNEIIETFKPSWYTSVFTVVLLVVSIISLSGVSTFLYFNF